MQVDHMRATFTLHAKVYEKSNSNTKPTKFIFEKLLFLLFSSSVTDIEQHCWLIIHLKLVTIGRELCM